MDHSVRSEEITMDQVVESSRFIRYGELPVGGVTVVQMQILGNRVSLES
jgi:hypothetical protein